MRFRMLLIAAALLVFASLSFGQNSVIVFDGSSYTLTGAGNTPLACGDTVYVFQAAGPAPLCTDVRPPMGSGAGQLDYNWFLICNDADGVGAGSFYTDPALNTGGGVNITPFNLYLVVPIPGSNPPMAYVSIIYNCSAPGPIFNDCNSAADWSMLPNCWIQSGPPPCVPTQGPVVLQGNGPYPGPQTASACVTLCRTNPTIQIVVGPIPLPDQRPTVTILPGCLASATSCDNSCSPAAGWVFDPALWTYDPATHTYSNVLVLPANGTEGCVCVHLDYILPVQYSSFAAVAGDNSVTINWATASETDLSHFEVMRNADKIADVNSNSNHTYTYTDGRAVNGTTYSYKVVAVLVDGRRVESSVVTATPDPTHAVVTDYALRQNYPNPFNPSTSISFDVKNAGFVTLKVYNAMGQEVATLFNGNANSNSRHTVSFDATNLPSGLYFYTVKAGNEFSATKKMLLVK